MEPRKRISPLIIIILSVVLVLGFAAFLYHNSKFRLVSATPSLNGTVATSTSVYELRFNRGIENRNYIQTVGGKDKKMVQSIRVNNSTVFVDLSPLDENTDYSILINGLRTVDGENTNIEINIKTRYIPFGKLSKAQQNLEISQTDRDNQTDPLMEFLPYQGDGFYLEGSYSETEEGEPIFIIEAQVFLLRSELTQDRNAVLDAYENKVHKYIQSKGLDSKKYLIRLDVTEPPSSIN